MLAQKNISKDYTGLFGQLFFEHSNATVPRYDVAHCDRKKFVNSIVSEFQSYSVQLVSHRDKTNNYLTPVNYVVSKPSPSWAGNIWSVPRSNRANENERIEEIIEQCAVSNDYQELRLLEGNFVAVKAQKNAVLLYRSLTSTTMLFYRLVDTGVKWSTNFMDLVDDPINDLNISKLALVALGGQKLPFDNIECLAKGTSIKIDKYGETTTTFDAFIASDLSHLKSIQDQGAAARSLLMASVKTKASRFSEVGLLLSGGLDSSAIARCLYDLHIPCRSFNWASAPFEVADESSYAREVARYLNQKITYIHTGSDRLEGSKFVVRTVPFETPYNHGLFHWWKQTIDIASSQVDCVITGRYGACFGAIHSPRYYAGLNQNGMQNMLHNLSTAKSSANIFTPVLGRVKRMLPLPWKSTAGLLFGLDSKAKHYRTKVVAAMQSIRQVENVDLQGLALQNTLFSPNDIQHFTPYLDRKLKEFTMGLPTSHKLAVYGGQFIDKPVLRFGFMDLLPPRVVKRNYRQYVSAIIQGYCCNNRHVIKEILHPDSLLTQLGILDQSRLNEILQNKDQLQKLANPLIKTLYTEQWLQEISKHNN